jgi:hypothetical protein
MVLADSHGIPRVPRYSGTCPKRQPGFRLRGFHPLWPGIPEPVRLPCCFVTLRPCGLTGPTTPPSKLDGLGYVRVRSPLLAESLLISVPVGTEMVHFPTLPSWTYGFSPGYPGMTPGGFPHSEISGSKLVCSSPKLIAAYHVLHRLLAPRHSPHALSSLTIRTPDLHHAAREGSAMKSRLSHTAVWSVKTTVCRIFSCQRVPACAPCRELRRDKPPNLPVTCQQSCSSSLACRAEARGASVGWWRIPGSNR